MGQSVGERGVRETGVKTWQHLASEMEQVGERGVRGILLHCNIWQMRTPAAAELSGAGRPLRSGSGPPGRPCLAAAAGGTCGRR